MTIISESGIVDSKIRFKMLNGKCDRLADCVGNVFDIVGYMIVENERDGETVTILDILTSDGRAIGTNSATVRRTFEAMLESFGNPTEETPFTGIVVTSKPSAKGRSFLDIDFAE